MELIKAVTTRRSIRAFKPKPVSRKVILEVLDIARWAPSGMNLQPWEFTIVIGPVFDEIKNAVEERLPTTLHLPANIPEMYKQRRTKQIDEIVKSMGEQEAYQNYTKARAIKGARFYDAPAAIIIYNDKAFTTTRNLDIGLLVENILLVAHDKGLGCCVMGTFSTYSDLIGRIIKLPESKSIIAGLIIGYPDMNAPENSLPRSREPIESLVNCSEGITETQ